MSRHIQVERLGGFAGFGGPDSHLRSRGSLALDGLTTEVRDAIAALFNGERKGAKDAHPDGFRYRVTLGTLSIEVDESHLPAILRDCVKDEIV